MIIFLARMRLVRTANSVPFQWNDPFLPLHLLTIATITCDFSFCTPASSTHLPDQNPELYALPTHCEMPRRKADTPQRHAKPGYKPLNPLSFWGAIRCFLLARTPLLLILGIHDPAMELLYGLRGSSVEHMSTHDCACMPGSCEQAVALFAQGMFCTH